ncbi:MAG: segregation/condensation protein A [Sedimentisphaerales bacterium]|nr:segregation/condensation protein A [Sedimentisphaerales bacterium]
MADYRVNLEIFAGPLDLLLHLVRKEEVDIYDIPIAKITDQYIRYIEILKQLDIDVAGDFLVMAATLMQIKSAMLLPSAPGEELGAEDLADPRAELIRQLLEYKRFKDAANLLAAAADEQGERFARPDTVIEQLKPAAEPTVDLDQISIWDLLEAFDAIMEATGAKFDMSHITDDTPIDLYQIEILHRLQTEGPMSFERIFESRGNRLAMVGLFLAILELIREQLIWAEQPKDTGQIHLRALTSTPAEEAVRKAMLAVEAASQQAEAIQQPTIPIVELPAQGVAMVRQAHHPERSRGKQSTEKLEPLGGETS